jgi:hypothetical protein
MTTLNKLCPWCGLPCMCTAFPFIIEGLVPIKCGERIVNEQPYIYNLRKLSPDQKNRAIANIRKIEQELKDEKSLDGM